MSFADFYARVVVPKMDNVVRAKAGSTIQRCQFYCRDGDPWECEDINDNICDYHDAEPIVRIDYFVSQRSTIDEQIPSLRWFEMQFWPTNEYMMPDALR